MSLFPSSQLSHLNAAADDRRRRLVQARIAGAAAVSLVGQVAVDVPDGFLGPADEMTLTGIGIAAAWLLLAGAVILALERHFHKALPWALSFLALGAGLFASAVTADPLIAGAVVLWHLTLIALISFSIPPTPRHDYRPRPEDDDRLSLIRLQRQRWERSVAPAQRHLALVTVVLTVAVVGYGLSAHPLASSLCAVLQLVSLALAAPFLRSVLAERRRSPWAVVGPVIAAALALALGSANSALGLLVLAQLVLLFLVVRDADTLHELVQSFFRHPSGLLVVSFVVIILVGTLFLTFPVASARPQAIAPLDALFTATSAVCVTGLIVLDTPHAFSPFGHAVLLALIQVGGLGIMVLSTYAMLLLGGNLGLRGEHALSQLLESQSSTAAYGLTRFIVGSTLAIEAIGAAVLALIFWRHGSEPGEAVWLGVFHSVSAFCNAGFALFSDSLVGFRNEPALLAVVGSLIVLGGLGFVVLYALWRRGAYGGLRSLSVQVKAVILSTVVLVLAGWAIYGVLEWQQTLAGLSFADKATNALFQSVTLRTAGFNSVDFADLSPATGLVMMLFMFIGASPGSTGGGIKTTTLVVLLAATFAMARGPGIVRLFDRELARATVYRALAILMASVGIVFATFFLLLVFEGQGLDALPFQSLLFEAFSAVGTVGLSLGATAQLGPMGKMVIIVAMFIGRVGPLTLALLLSTIDREQRIRHARARIMVG